MKTSIDVAKFVDRTENKHSFPMLMEWVRSIDGNNRLRVLFFTENVGMRIQPAHPRHGQLETWISCRHSDWMPAKGEVTVTFKTE